jgi:hypothetical protein
MNTLSVACSKRYGEQRGEGVDRLDSSLERKTMFRRRQT